MEIKLTNLIHNCKVRMYEWNPKRIFEKPLSELIPLRRVNEFTEADKVRLEELEKIRRNPYLTEELYKAIENEAISSDGDKRMHLFGLLENPNFHEKERAKMDRESLSLQIGEGVEEWKGESRNKKVEISLVMGWTCGDCSDYEETISLEGKDEQILNKIVSIVKASEEDITRVTEEHYAMRAKIFKEIDDKYDTEVIPPHTVKFVPKKSKEAQ